jgi:hypothetical protein
LAVQKVDLMAASKAEHLVVQKVAYLVAYWVVQREHLMAEN